MLAVTKRTRWWCMLAVIFSSAPWADEVAQVERGTQGLDKFVIAVSNQGARVLSCEVSTAHWYSVALGDIAPGKSLYTAMWKNRRSGEVFILNQRQDRMPVQRLWCGRRGDSWQTRYQFTLPDRRQQRPYSQRYHCRDTVNGTRCQPVT